MKKAINIFQNNIEKQIQKELTKTKKKYNFINKINKIDFEENSFIFESILYFLCDPSKTLRISIAAENNNIQFKKGKIIFEETKKEVKDLFNKKLYLKNNKLSLNSYNVIIDMNLLKDISFNKNVFDIYLDFLYTYSDILNQYNKIEEYIEVIKDYFFNLNNLNLTFSSSIDTIDNKNLKQLIKEHNKKYFKFVKKFNIFGMPYKLLIKI
jgi:hypothetical protein